MISEQILYTETISDSTMEPSIVIADGRRNGEMEHGEVGK